MYVCRNNEALSCNHCCRRIAESITCSKFMLVALGIHHAQRIRRITLLSVACKDPPYLSTLSHKRHDSRGKKNVIEYRIGFVISSTNLSEIFLILRRVQRDTIKCTQVSIWGTRWRSWLRHCATSRKVGIFSLT